MVSYKLNQMILTSSYLQRWATTSGLMLLGLAIGLCLFTFNIIGFNFAYFPGDLGDGRLNLYFLEHAHRFFTGEVSSFWNAPFMYPEANVMSYSDNLLGSSPIYSFFRILGLGTYKSYQWWYIVVTALNYIAAFCFLRYVFKNSHAAVLGAFIFAFSIALQSQLTHAQTFPRFAIPLAMLMAVKFGEGLKPKYLLFAILLVVYQIYCALHLGFKLAVPVGIYILVIFWKEHKTIFCTRWLFKISAFVVMGLLLLLPLMINYSGRNIAPSIEHYKNISSTLPSITSYLFSQHGSIFWDFLSKTGANYNAWWDHQIFAGGVATLSLIFALSWMLYHLILSKFKRNLFSNPVFVLTLTGFCTFILFLRIGEYISAYFPIYFFPGFSSMRSLTRIINIELIFFATATALVFVKIWNHFPKQKHLIFAAALALVVADNFFHADSTYRTKVTLAMQRTLTLENEFAQIPPGSVVSYEPYAMASASIFYHLDAMLLAQKFGLKSVNAYTATSPSSFNMFWREPNERSRNYWLSDKDLSPDSIYVVKRKNYTKKVCVHDIHAYDLASVKEERLRSLIDYIQTDQDWMQVIEQKAREKNISVDSMLLLDAIWVLEHEN
jgi:hypothetical protein